MNKVTSDILLKSRKRGLIYCLPPEESVLTRDGYRPIVDVETGDEVLTHRGRYREVTGKMDREVDEDIVHVIPSKEELDDFKLTGEHLVYVLDYKMKPLLFDWIESYQLDNDRYALVKPKEDGGLVLDNQYGVECEDYFGKVYNLEVEEDNSYVTRGSAVHNCFTTQSMKQIDRRVRDVMDYTCYPIMNPRETICKLLIFQGPKPNKGNLLDKIYFKTEPVYKLYDSITGDQEVPVYIDEDLRYMRMEDIGDYTDELLHVPSFDKETGEIELKEVKKYHRRYVKKDIYRVKTKYGREIKVTRDHSLFTIEGDDIVEASVADLDYGDVIAIPRKMPSEDGGWDYLDCDDDDIHKGDLVFVPIEEISKVNHHGMFVYDFSVEDNENFIASGVNASNTREEVKSLKPKSDVPFEEVEREPRDLSEDGEEFDII